MDGWMDSTTNTGDERWQKQYRRWWRKYYDRPRRNVLCSSMASFYSGLQQHRLYYIYAIIVLSNCVWIGNIVKSFNYVMSKPMILFAIVILIQIKVRFCEWMNDKTNDSSISVIGYSKKSSHLKCLLHFFKNDVVYVKIKYPANKPPKLLRLNF